MDYKFRDYLLKKMGDYDQEIGKRVTHSEFAKYLGVNRVSLTQWLNGSKPDIENTQKLALKLGDEVFDVLGYKRTNLNIAKLQVYYDSVPTENQDWLLDQIENILISKGWIRSPQSPNTNGERRNNQ